MNDRCEQYWSAPENDPSHLDGCAECRSVSEGLSASRIEPRAALSGQLANSLPVAPWEGAGERSWSLAGVAALLLAAGIVALFASVGISPIEGFAVAVRSSIESRLALLSHSGSLAKGIGEAPVQFHLAILVSFVVVNVIFYRLLRRSLKGYDVTPR